MACFCGNCVSCNHQLSAAFSILVQLRGMRHSVSLILFLGILGHLLFLGRNLDEDEMMMFLVITLLKMPGFGAMNLGILREERQYSGQRSSQSKFCSNDPNIFQLSSWCAEVFFELFASSQLCTWQIWQCLVRKVGQRDRWVTGEMSSELSSLHIAEWRVDRLLCCEKAK